MKRLKYMICGFCIFAFCSSNNAMAQTISSRDMSATYKELKSIFEVLSPRVIRPAEGYLHYPYLIPAGFYTQMWDWDGFFMGNYFCSKGRPEYLKYWALNLIEGIDEKGYVSGCATTKGPRPIFGNFSMKPFLAQGMLFASIGLNDYKWIKPYYDKLKLSVKYREDTQQDKDTGLFFWQNGMQSGADNNVALNYFMEDKRSFLACDASTLQLREYEALSVIAFRLGYSEDVNLYNSKAQTLKSAINKYLWCQEDQTYYNIDRETGKFYKRISYSNFWPLFDKLASDKDGKAMIKRYLINDKHMKSAFGFRSLSKQDPDYNNKNIIVPFSNWQGPLWMVANYIDGIILKHYGFEKELRWATYTLGKLLIKDYNQYGSLHESYDAETGKPLAPADSYVDKNGKFIGFISWDLCIEELFQGIIDGHWTTLEIPEAASNRL
jgi:alpha,alpha-trehalase